jgi:putative inorganic carbon (hco3(-)) transporter
MRRQFTAGRIRSPIGPGFGAMGNPTVIFFYLLISAMPLVLHPFWSMFMGELTMIKYLGVICFVYALLHLTERRTALRLFTTPQARWFIALIILVALSFLVHGAPVSFDSSPFMACISFLLLFVTTLILVDSLERLRYVLLAGVGSMAFASIYVLREWQKSGFAAKVRPGWVTGDANYFTASVLVFLPVAFCLMRRGTLLQRAFCAGCLTLTLLAVTGASSRGGFLALVVMSLLLMWRISRRFGASILVGMLLLLLTVVSPSSPLDRFLNPVSGDIKAENMRWILWEAGLRVAADHPWTGIGPGNFKSVITRYYEEPETTPAHIAHNTYIETAAEIGLPGLGILLACLITTLASLEHLRRRTSVKGPAFLHDTALALQAGLIGYSVSAFFLSALWNKFLWLAICLSMCLPSIERAALRSRIRRLKPNRENAVA